MDICAFSCGAWLEIGYTHAAPFCRGYKARGKGAPAREVLTATEIGCEWRPG